jgi:protein SCO1/2
VIERATLRRLFRTRGRCATALVTLLAVVGCESAAAQKETELSGRPAPEINAVAARSGTPLKLHDQRGKAVLLSFGYTSCVDICPFTLATMGAVLRQLGPEASAVRAYYITLDPARDTLTHLREFLQPFDPRIEGLVVREGSLPQVLQGYGVVAKRRAANLRRYLSRQNDPDADYSFDHTAALWLVDKAGRLRVRYAHDAEPDRISGALRELLHD